MPMVTGTDDHCWRLLWPLTVSRLRDEETNRSPPVRGSVCTSCRPRDVVVCACGRNSVTALPVAESTPGTWMMERL